MAGPRDRNRTRSASSSAPPTAGRLARDGATPLWVQLHDDLRARLESGEFVDEVPGELALAALYGVSRNTVREALRRLRADGLVESGRGRRPRRGVGVEIEQPLGALYSLFRSVEDRGLAQNSVVRSLEIRRDESVADRLDRAKDTALLYLERLRLAGGEPLALDRTWLPAELAGSLIDVDFSHAGFYDELASRTGLRLNGGSERIRAVVPAPALRRLLGIGHGVAALEIERLGAVDGAAVEWRETTVRGDRFSVVSDFPVRSGYLLAEARPQAPVRAVSTTREILPFATS